MKTICFQRINFFVLLLLFFFVHSNTVFGAIIRIPADYATIQGGVDAASDGDTILLANGTYAGAGNKDLDINKAITVRSENGPWNCIIDCEGNGRGFELHGDARCTINGITITNGFADYGGAIRCGKSNTIINCRIIDNQASQSGGGVFFSSGDLYEPARIINSIFAGNTATWGGAMYFSYSNAQVVNCTTIENTGTGAVGNSCTSNPPSFTNCILWEDSFYLDPFCLPTFSYCDIKGTSITGTTIINSDPLFVDVSDPSPINWDLHLLSSSQCIDSGTSEGAPPYDIDGNLRPQGSGYDIGAYENGGPPPLNANFSANPTSGTAPLTVNFTNLSTGTVNSWNWSFGDNSTSNDQAPSHTYNDPGSYTVTLTVSGPEGSDAEGKPDYIKVTYPSEFKPMPWIPLLLLK